jgi:hypothetical protein
VSGEYPFLFKSWLSTVAITFGDPVWFELSTQTFSLLRRLWRFLFPLLSPASWLRLVAITFGDPVWFKLSTQTFSLLRRLWRFLFPLLSPASWLRLENKNLHRFAVKVFVEVGGGFEPPYPVLQTDA